MYSNVAMFSNVASDVVQMFDDTALCVSADGLRCLQCHSLHQSLCEDGRLAPNDCLDDVNSTHCVKMEAKLQMGTRTLA